MPITTIKVPPEPLFPEQQVERDYNLAHGHLRYCRRIGDHPQFTKRGVRYYYRKSDIEVWLAKTTVPAPATAGGAS